MHDQFMFCVLLTYSMAYETCRFNAAFTSLINPVPRTDTYLFRINSNIVLPLRLSLPRGLLPVKILKSSYLLSFLLHADKLN